MVTTMQARHRVTSILIMPLLSLSRTGSACKKRDNRIHLTCNDKTSMCGGTGDRLKGITSLFDALRLGANFKILLSRDDTGRYFVVKPNFRVSSEVDYATIDAIDRADGPAEPCAACAVCFVLLCFVA